MNRIDHSIWWLVNLANVLGLNLLSQVKLTAEFADSSNKAQGLTDSRLLLSKASFDINENIMITGSYPDNIFGN